MKEISRGKRLEVATCYMLGQTFEQIEIETGVSHGSIANIVSELETGKLTIPGTPFDQVSDLRQLSSDLRKKGLEPSQSLLGLTFFSRLRTLEVTPEHLDTWTLLVRKFSSPEFPAEEFLSAAIRIRDLENSQGESFENLAGQYLRLCEEGTKLKRDVDSLSRNKSALSEEVRPLSSTVESLKKEKGRLENDVEFETVKLKDLGMGVKEARQEKSLLKKEIRALKQKGVKLSSEVEGREDTLRRLNEIGLSDEDLLRLNAFLERTSKSEGMSLDQVRDKFFSVLALFKDISGLEEKREAEVQEVEQLNKEKSALTGEILELEKRKQVLESQIADSVSSTLQMIREVGTGAVAQIQQEVADIRRPLQNLCEDIMKAGEAVGQMYQMVKEGEDSERSLREFTKEFQNRLG